MYSLCTKFLYIKIAKKAHMTFMTVMRNSMSSHCDKRRAFPHKFTVGTISRKQEYPSVEPPWSHLATPEPSRWLQGGSSEKPAPRGGLGVAPQPCFSTFSSDTSLVANQTWRDRPSRRFGQQPDSRQKKGDSRLRSYPGNYPLNPSSRCSDGSLVDFFLLFYFFPLLFLCK